MTRPSPFGGEIGDQMAAAHVHVIACGVLAVDIKAVAKRLGLSVSMEFLPGGLHRRPNELRRRLQESIDVASAEQRGEMILIGYGLCGLGTVGLHARHIPLAVPRVHDCIALFLGSDAAYKEQFARYPGTYYISAGWVEEDTRPLPMDEGAEAPANHGDTLQFGSTTLDYQTLVAKHGHENAEAIRHFLNSWQRNYQRAAFIDTGAVGRKRRYAEVARAMAEEFGWAYEELAGTDELLTKLLTVRHTTDDVLVVLPHHVTAYNAVTKRLEASPVWESQGAQLGRKHTQVYADDADDASTDAERTVRLGLGIDAGGTYTDVVLYDFPGDRVVAKAKALTTKIDYTIGIDNALDQLNTGELARVDLVSVSTTLATNAIVEGRGQRVGLLIMPPYGMFDPSHISHRPIAVIDGKMEIDGSEIAPIDPDQIRRIVRKMIDEQHVQAFAVTGFGSPNNPSHELQVKHVIRAETKLTVTCGHEVSQTLNYRIRAATAALNARIIPYLESLLEKVRLSLSRRGIRAPIMVVRSDGSLMGVEAARQRPIETILSGPAASVAGARYLTGSSDAIVVDIGGTTTDTATIRRGAVKTCDEGATVGGWRTHVRALHMRTTGLGGDSRIAYEKRILRIGPRRVAPVAWLLRHQPAGTRALDWIERNVGHFDASTQGMDLIALNGQPAHNALRAEELRILEALSERPHSLDELARRLDAIAWRFLPLAGLEERHLIHRCALTPTDLLCATGRLGLWDVDAARRISDVFAHLMGLDREAFADRALRQVVENLAVELIKTQLDEETDADDLERSPAARALIDNLLSGGSRGYRVRVRLTQPVIGIGAPAHVFLPQAAKLLETEAVIPSHADVANAIGAITSSVQIHKHVQITPNDLGSYSIYGLADSPTFVNFHEAHDYAVEHLVSAVRELARQSGTSQTRVEVTVDDRIAPLSGGGQIFVGRTLEARLTGAPDLARLTTA